MCTAWQKYVMARYACHTPEQQAKVLNVDVQQGLLMLLFPASKHDECAADHMSLP